MRTSWLALALLLAASAPAALRAEDDGSGTLEATASISGTVVRVDLEDRRLILEDESFRVHERVPNLGDLEAGDHVSVFFFQQGDDHIAVLLEETPKLGS
jgi:hypothetical protein